jgi:aspartyl aminopeptidase
VSSLCIHLQTGAERKSFSPNKEREIRPILSSEIYTQLAGIKDPKIKAPLSDRHHWGLLEFISKSIKVPVEDILELDLSFADTQPA